MDSQKKLINKSNNNLSSDEQGGFSAVPHEMSEMLMRLDLTAKEFRICWFLIRELQGFQLKQKIIKTAKFIKDIGLPKQHVNECVKSLIRKGVIERSEIDNGQRGEYLYQFNERVFGKVHATKTVRYSYFEGGKVIHISKSRSQNQLPQGHQISDHEVTESVTMENTRSATRAVTQQMKDILKKEKDILRGRVVDSYDWKTGQSEEETQRRREQAREYLEVLKSEEMSKVKL